MKNFRVRRIHIVCLAIATAEILIAAFVLWKNAIWNETQIQTANKQSVLSETQEETTSDIQENEKTATQNQEETKPVEEAVSSMPSMRVKLKNSDNTMPLLVVSLQVHDCRRWPRPRRPVPRPLPRGRSLRPRPRRIRRIPLP